MLAKHSRLRAAALFSVLAAASLPSQTPGKCASFDFGELRYGTAVLRPSGELEVHSDRRSIRTNSVLAQSGVADIAVIPGFESGDRERLVTVGDSGVTTYTWIGSESVEFQVTPWNEPSLQGATMIRAISASAIQQSLVGVRKSSGTTLHVYRAGASHQFLCNLFVGAQILDFEFAVTDSGVPVIFVLVPGQLECRALNGSILWSAPGSGGDLLRMAPSGNQVGWLQQSTPAWRLDLFDHAGLADSVDLALPVADPVLSVMRGDCDEDGQSDLIVKTPGSLWVMLAQAGSFQVEPIAIYESPETYEPCVVTTDGNAHVWLADVTAADDFTWRSLRISDNDGSTANIVVEAALLADTVPDPTLTTMSLGIAMPTDWVARFAAPGLSPCVQIIAWREGAPNTGIDRVSEPSYLDPLVNPTINAGVSSWNGIPLTVGEIRVADEEGDYWNGEPHFWLEMRLCMIDAVGRVRRASDPAYAVMTISELQRASGYPYLHHVTDAFSGWTTDIGQLPPLDGIILVGVISEPELPPPPPQSGGLPIVDNRGVRPPQN